MLDVAAEIQRCALEVHQRTMQKVVAVESGGNPYAIGVVGGRLERQPRTLHEAVATAHALEEAGWNYSVGLAQVNRTHFRRLGWSLTAAFDPCGNLRAGAAILRDCYLATTRRKVTTREQQQAIRDALSCYYSGNFTRGYQLGYVQKVVEADPIGRSQTQQGGTTNSTSLRIGEMQK